MEKTMISLGAESLQVVPITLGVLKKIGIGSAKMQKEDGGGDPVAKEAAWYEGTMDVICAGTGKTPAEIEAIQDVTLQQLLTANRTVFLVSGLVTEKADAKPKVGEESGASTG